MTDNDQASLSDTEHSNTPAIDRGKSDYARLLNYLRALRRDIHTGTYATNRLFVQVSEDSPLFGIAQAYSSALQNLKIAISRPDTQSALTPFNKGLLDFSKPFTCLLHSNPSKSGRVHTLQIYGTTTAGKATTLQLSDAWLKLIGPTDPLSTIAAGLSAVSAHRALVIHESLGLSLHSFLDYYGIKLPIIAQHDDLVSAINDLLPKETPQPTAAVAMPHPFNLPEQPRFVLNASQVYSFRQRTAEEHGTDDYAVITEEIKKDMQQTRTRCRTLLQAHTHYGASLASNEQALLAMLQQAGGITLRLVVFDSDGEDDIYRRQHTANPWRAETLEDYFTQAEAELSAYMINSIQYGEGEGAINIEKLIIETIVPTIVLQSHNLSALYIQAFDIRSKEPPALYLDPLAKNAYATISARFTELSQELQKANWDITCSATLKRAAEKLLAHYRDDIASEAAYLKRLNEAVNVYYSVLAQNLEAQQRLKIILQPTQSEFISRALCRYLGLDEYHWGVIAQARFDIHYAASWKNTGTFVWHEKAVGYETLLSVIYDESLRREIALADDRETLLQELTEAISTKTAYVGQPDALKAKLGGLFDANVAFVNNGNLPDDLTKPQEAFTREAEAYTLKATDEFRALEAERIILTADNAATRLRSSQRSATASTDKALYCIELLTTAEQSLLESRTQAYATFLRARTNNDDIQDMSTAAQHVLQLVRQVGGLIPVVGNFINLAFDLYEGNNEGIALDALNIFAELVLLKFRALPPRALGTLMLQGTNMWMLIQQTEALRASIKANDYPASVAQFGFLLLGMHSALQCGASIVHGFTDAAAARYRDTAGERPQVIPIVEEAMPAYATEGETTPPSEEASPSRSASNPHWAISDDGQVSARQTGSKVSAVDWNGNAIVEGGTRAVMLGDINEPLYMLHGQAQRAVMGLHGPELRPLHLLDIEGGQWRKQSAGTGTTVVFSRFNHTEAFPVEFSGRPERRIAPANAASWYDNCIATFDSLTAEVIDVHGQKTRQNVAIGVIEHKYVTERSGHVEVLEHTDNTDGHTTFTRPDGSRWTVAAELPAMPHYQPEIHARIVAAQGMFVSVEICETLAGLTGKRKVAGVLATLSNGGGQELIIEADRGVHYRGAIAADQALNLAPGETAADQQPIALQMSKISPEADPKRASPALWRDQPEYRNTLAHDDFALELFYGAKAANEAYARHPQWVQQNMTAVGKIKAQLPEPITTVENPFYVLDTREEQAILFAPRNQAALANTLLAKTIEWGEATTARPLALGEKLLRQLRTHKPLLGAAETIPAQVADRASLNRQLKATLGQNNLLLAQVQGQTGEKAWFAQSLAQALSVAPGDIHDDIHLSRSGSIIDRIESQYPDPAAIKSIVILSVDEVSETDARRIFVSSQRGYTYESVTSLEQPVANPELAPVDVQLHIADIHYPERAQEIRITRSVVDLSGATAITSGPQQGSYLSAGRYYVKLDNGKIYRAHWNSENKVFVLVPPEGKLLANTWAYPWVRHTGGREFTLINQPRLKGGNWQAQTINGIRTRRYERATGRYGQLLAAQRRNNQEIQVHQDDLHVADGDNVAHGKLNITDTLFTLSGPDPDGYITLKSRLEVPESCISSTEYLISRYAGGTSNFDYAGERSGNAKPVVPNVEVVARYNNQPVSLNISTTPLDSWVGAPGYGDYLSENESLPKTGEGIGFIRQHEAPGTPASEYDFHFMFIAGTVNDANGHLTGLLATDLSEPPRKTEKAKLPATRNWNLGLYASIDEMRGAVNPEQNYYPQDQYYSVLVRPVGETL